MSGFEAYKAIFSKSQEGATFSVKIRLLKDSRSAVVYTSYTRDLRQKRRYFLENVLTFKKDATPLPEDITIVF